MAEWPTTEQQHFDQAVLMGIATGATNVHFSLRPVPVSDSHSLARLERERRS